MRNQNHLHKTISGALSTKIAITRESRQLFGSKSDWATTPNRDQTLQRRTYQDNSLHEVNNYSSESYDAILRFLYTKLINTLPSLSGGLLKSCPKL